MNFSDGSFGLGLLGLGCAGGNLLDVLTRFDRASIKLSDDSVPLNGQSSGSMFVIVPDPGLDAIAHEAGSGMTQL